MSKKKKNKKKYISVTLVLILMAVVVAGLAGLTFFEMQRYEDGLIDVCATQQDSYVQLVIDQINLKENRTDQEIIENILSTLDSSSNRYWTFSKEQTMLYVKDALETNRYQSLTANSYYRSDSATNFIDNLIVNKVNHERIELDGKDYIASGALFEYGGEEYRICLLTNTTVLLDNNKFLGSKMEMIIIFIVVYSLIFIMPIILTIMHNIMQKKIFETGQELKEVNSAVEKLNEKLTTDEIYDNRKNLFSLPTVRLFMEEYKDKRAAFPISFIAFRYGDKETVSRFFGRNCVTLGKHDIRFYDGRLHLALILSVKCNATKAKELSKAVKGDCEFLGSETAATATAMEEKFNKIMERMGNPPLTGVETGKVMRPDSRTESRYRTKSENTEDKKNA
ncbi:hypothetical protein [Butyrivibrio sp. XPD2006]|uniref:hypothetical protein n=1 Tax=Butyrivibrio sp. XPD2006 TaxID=1280668 RepID=UPI0003B3AB6B|nr:hypothetical protein [Butyrivibrio sp. XPD2006]